MTEKDKDAHSLYERNRKRLQRAKAKHILPSPSTSNESSPITPYSCKQTLNKAVLKQLEHYLIHQGNKKELVQALPSELAYNWQMKWRNNNLKEW